MSCNCMPAHDEYSNFEGAHHEQDCPKYRPAAIEKAEQKEMVNHPAHYGGEDNPYEVIKVIEAWGLGFCLGNTVKYVARADHKGTPLEDLKKARWYLDREISNRENSNETHR